MWVDLEPDPKSAGRSRGFCPLNGWIMFEIVFNGGIEVVGRTRKRKYHGGSMSKMVIPS